MSEHSRREFMVRSATAGALALGARDLLAADARAANMTIAKWTGAEATGSSQIDKVAAQLTEKAIQAQIERLQESFVAQFFFMPASIRQPFTVAVVRLMFGEMVR